MVLVSALCVFMCAFLSTPLCDNHSCGVAPNEV